MSWQTTPLHPHLIKALTPYFLNLDGKNPSLVKLPSCMNEVQVKNLGPHSAKLLKILSANTNETLGPMSFNQSGDWFSINFEGQISNVL